MDTEISTKQKPSCFVVMPFGRDAAEQKWFKGWYEVVLVPAIHASGYEPVLSAGEEQPGAINDEIRAHLAYDPMVLVDLGGFEPTDDPNPNVMYELGIRHALTLPLVIMAWEGQRLPFDVSNQRVIMHGRDLLDIEANKKKIVAFIQAAAEGKYYKPMDAVGRMATIAAASENLGEDALLSALVQEVRELKGSLHSVVNNPRREISWDSTLSVRALLRDKNLRKELFALFEGLGGTSKTWAEVLRKRVSVEFAQATKSWPDSEWKRYIEDEFASLPPPVKKAPPEETVSPPVPIAPPSPPPIDDGLVERVRLALPVQPWPKGIHKEIIADLKITAHQYKKAVATLTNRGVFKQQVDGVLLDMDV